MVLGPSDAAQLREMVNRFEGIFGGIDFPVRFGAANTAGDLLFVMASLVRDRQEER
ncbi:MAG: hypothetical protein QOI58_3113 [Thermoanaerobaculia bacterium]|nr:hypothetical protein [Thermoanaerobaculia bacterium]